MAEKLAEFAFIVIVPLAIVAGAVVTLFLVGALFMSLEQKEGLKQRLEALFRRPPAPPRPPAADHYYKAYWQEQGHK